MILFTLHALPVDIPGKPVAFAPLLHEESRWASPSGGDHMRMRTARDEVGEGAWRKVGEGAWRI
jgi:hypothetical protein